MLTKWIIAIGNTEADGVRMLYTIGSVDQIKRALVELALEDKSNDEESFNYGTEGISDVEETADSKTNEVTVLNAYNVFSDYILIIRHNDWILCRCVKSEKGELSMREGIRYDWIIAVSNSADRNGVKILKTCGKVSEIKKILVDLAKRDAKKDINSFELGTDDISSCRL